jgi:hypothetical protein
MFYFDFRTYATMMRLAIAERPRGGRCLLILFLAVCIPVFALGNAICMALDLLLFPGFLRVAVREPVFIVGHARSGTTLLHQLMSRDAERFSVFLTWELFFPAICQKKLVRLIARLDERWFRGSWARRIRAWEDRKFAKGRQMHPMSLTGPEEDEFVLAPSCASGVWVLVFPYWRELQHLYYTDDMAPARRKRLLRFYRACVQRQLYLNGGEKVHLSKNPTFSGKVASLIETFPGARFVVCMRNPLETIPSLLKLMTRNWKAGRCPPERIEESRRLLAEQSYHTYRHPIEVLSAHPDVRWTLVDYRDLVESPKRTVRSVYDVLGLEMTAGYEAVLDDEETRSRSHRTEHVYSLGEFGLDHQQIRERLGDLFERHRWDSTTADTTRVLSAQPGLETLS